MTPRAAVTAVTLALLVLINGRLILQEERQTFEQATVHEARLEDIMFGATYNAASRRDNMERIGLSKDEARAMQTRIASLEGKHASSLRSLMASSGDPDALEAVFCPGGNPPRYAALLFFVDEKRGEREVVDPGRLTTLEAMDWARERQDLIWRVYGDIDRTKGREEEASLLALSAILLGEEQAILDGEQPWGYFSSWSSVQEERSGIAERLYDYLALMHLAAEVAQGDGGICN